MAACQLDGRLVGLGARVDEEGAVERGAGDELLGQLELLLPERRTAQGLGLRARVHEHALPRRRVWGR